MKTIMRTITLCTISSLLLSGNTVLAAQPQIEVVTKSTKAAVNECQIIANALRNNSSYSQILTTIKRFKKQLTSCKSTLQKDRQLSKHIKKLSQQEEQRLKRAMKKSIASKSRAVPSHKLKINQRLARFKMQGKSRLASLKASSSSKKSIAALDNVSRPNSGSPVKASITPTNIVPGLFAAIEGNGIHFGNRQGSVELQVGNRVIPVNINSWRPDWISVQFPEDISGLPISNTNAAVIVRNGDLGSRTHIDVDFMPVYEQIEVWDAYALLPFPPDIFNIGGSSGEVTLFENAVLGTHWHVSDIEFIDPDVGRCQQGRPFMAVGGTRLSSKIHWTRPWNETLYCAIVVTVEGPRGMPSNTENLYQN